MERRGRENWGRITQVGVARFFQKNSADKEVSNDGMFNHSGRRWFRFKTFLVFQYTWNLSLWSHLTMKIHYSYMDNEQHDVFRWLKEGAKDSFQLEYVTFYSRRHWASILYLSVCEILFIVRGLQNEIRHIYNTWGRGNEREWWSIHVKNELLKFRFLTLIVRFAMMLLAVRFKSRLSAKVSQFWSVAKIRS